MSRRKVLVLDCCYSGAFLQGAKSAAALGSRINATGLFSGSGYGQVVVTASDTMQYAWEGNKIIGNTDKSFFTHYFIEGLKTGKADVDKDGCISITELYSFVYDRVINRQTPSISSNEMEGKILLAHNPYPAVRPDLLPNELLKSLSSQQTWQREGAIIELGRLLGSEDSLIANTARHYLAKLANDDSRKVSLAAQQMLSGDRKGQQSSHVQQTSNSFPSSSNQARQDLINDSIQKLHGEKSSLERPTNTSGLGKFAKVPDEIKGKWNWGAFLLGWIWGIGNSTWISFAQFIPYVGIFVCFILGLKGNEWAWRNKQWESVEHFQKVQKKWRNWGFIISGVVFLLMIFLFAIG